MTDDGLLHGVRGLEEPPERGLLRVVRQWSWVGPV
jgi:hypothetical protein